MNVFQRKAFDSIVRRRLVDLNKEAKEGGEVPNIKLVSLEGKVCNLLNFMRNHRPLVLNFGSASWSMFIVDVSEIDVSKNS